MAGKVLYYPVKVKEDKFIKLIAYKIYKIKMKIL